MDIAKRLVKLLLFVLITIASLVLTIIFRCAALLLSMFDPMTGLLIMSRTRHRGALRRRMRAE